MCFKVALLVEGLPAVFKWTDKVTYPLVLLQMHLKAPLAGVRGITAGESTPEHFEFFVSLHVVF